MFVLFNPLIRRVGAVAMSISSIIIIKSRTWATASNWHYFLGYAPDSVVSADGAVGVAYLSRPWRRDIVFVTQSCSRFTCKAGRLLHAKLFAFYMQSWSTFTCKAARLLHAKLFAFHVQSCSPFTCNAIHTYMQSCSPFTCKTVRLLHAKQSDLFWHSHF